MTAETKIRPRPAAVVLTPAAEARVAALMARVNQTLEEWIRDRPGGWFWLHRRWPD